MVSSLGDRGGEDLAIRESRGIGGFRGDPSAGFPQAPEFCLCWTAEVAPAGVGIRTEGHPWHRRRLRPGR